MNHSESHKENLCFRFLKQISLNICGSRLPHCALVNIEKAQLHFKPECSSSEGRLIN